MAKVALLIGTADYTQGFNSLPAAPRDVRAFEAILRNPQMGDFDQVTALINPQRDQMAETIETWFQEHQKDDLALLYISGHGMRDEQGELYFAASNTRKQNGILVRSTAVSASFVRDRTRESKAKRQILILDCCFSGAFGNLLPRDDNAVDLESIFAKEVGRVVLTSSDSVQYSFEQRDGDLSIYTSYLIQGIQTGAADLDGNGVITVQELHQYTCREVKKVAPAMTPKIIVLRDEGYQISIAKAPLGDPKPKYLRKVAEFAEEDGGEISDESRVFLDALRTSLGLSEEDAKTVEFEVLASYQTLKGKLNDYRRLFLRSIERQYPISARDENNLLEFQRILNLRDKDVNPIKRQILLRQIQTGKIVAPLLRGLFRDAWKLVALGLFAVLAISLAQIISGLIWSDRKSDLAGTPFQMSFGETVLVPQESRNCQLTAAQQEEFETVKMQGIESFKANRFTDAIAAFEQALTLCKNAPETVIYRNNARVSVKNSDQIYNLAVSAPLVNEPLRGNALMMLRGFAQAQTEINALGQISLRLQVINDEDSPEKATAIAQTLTRQDDILAVAGHWTSDVSLAAAPIYNSAQKVFITPLSTIKALGNYRPYVFRVNVTTQKGAQALAQYIKETLGSQKSYLYFDPKNNYSLELKNELKKELTANSAIITEEIDLSSRSEIDASIEQVLTDSNAVIVLVPSPARLEDALYITSEMAINNQRQVPIVGDITNLYIPESLKRQSQGMVLAPAWNITAASDTSFTRDAIAYWGGEVGAPAALSYSALKAIAQSIEQTLALGDVPSAATIERTLVNPNFLVEGVFENGLKFFEDGSSNVESQLVKVCPSQGSYKFLPITISDLNCPI